MGMLEVLASALLVAMLSVGVMKTFDAANAASGNTKSRAVAADLAQQDQERMRAFRAKELSNLNATYTRTVAGVNFTITSQATWVNDGSGTRRCGLTSGRADYLRISSSVVWDRMRGAAPVTSTSLYAPPSGSFGDEGNLGFEVLNRSAVGVPGVSVTLSGQANRSGVTDSDGCIFFGFLPQGNYTATINKAGYVDYNGNSTITKTYGVNGRHHPGAAARLRPGRDGRRERAQLAQHVVQRRHRGRAGRPREPRALPDRLAELPHLRGRHAALLLRGRPGPDRLLPVHGPVLGLYRQLRAERGHGHHDAGEPECHHHGQRERAGCPDPGRGQRDHRRHPPRDDAPGHHREAHPEVHGLLGRADAQARQRGLGRADQRRRRPSTRASPTASTTSAPPTTRASASSTTSRSNGPTGDSFTVPNTTADPSGTC